MRAARSTDLRRGGPAAFDAARPRVRQIATIQAFRMAAIQAGLGELPADDLAFLKTYYDDACDFVVTLDDAVAPEDEPATVFRPLPSA